MEFYMYRGGRRLDLLPWQKAAVEQALEYVQTRNVEFLGPPGVGKTTLAIGIAVHETERLGTGKVYVVTHTNRLAADIYRRVDCAGGGFCFGREPHMAALLVGMANHRCPVYNTTVDNAPCRSYGVVDRAIQFPCYGGPTKVELSSSVKYRGVGGVTVHLRRGREVSCPYSLQFYDALHADIIVTSAYFILTHADTGFLPEPPHGSVFVFDEEHQTLIKLVRNEVSIPFSVFEAARKMAVRRLRQAGLLDDPEARRKVYIATLYKNEKTCIDAVHAAAELLEAAGLLEEFPEFEAARKRTECWVDKEAAAVYVSSRNKSLPFHYRFISTGVPPGFGEAAWRELGFTNVKTVYMHKKLGRPITFVVDRHAEAVSSRRRAQALRLKQVHMRLRLLLDAESVVIDGVEYPGKTIEAYYSPFNPYKNGYPVLPLEKSASVDKWEGIDVTEPRNVILTRVAYKAMDEFWRRHQELYRRAAAMATVNAATRGARGDDGVRVFVWTLDTYALEVARIIAKFADVEVRRVESAAVTLDCGGVEKTVDLYGEIDEYDLRTCRPVKVAASTVPLATERQPTEQQPQPL
jgi:RecA/RadA recombinase